MTLDYCITALRVKRLHPDAILPSRGTRSSAGYDLYTLESAEVRPFVTVRVRTGIAIELPTGICGLIKPRSSAYYKGWDLDGTIDEDYRGEILLQLRNTTSQTMYVNKGERYGQLVLSPYCDSVQGTVVVEEMSSTARGEGGFGSTGK
jgi:dUTP pyrophosphatase